MPPTYPFYYMIYLKKSLLNVISVDKKWLNLETSRSSAKQLLNYYSINNQKMIKVPTVFPVVVKTDNLKETYIANTMQELVVWCNKRNNQV